MIKNYQYISISRRIRTRLRLLRKKAGYTEWEVADAIGVLPKSIAAFEAGYRLPSPVTLRKYAALFDVTLDYLYGLVDDPHGYGFDRAKYFYRNWY